MQAQAKRNNAARRLSIFLRMQKLPYDFEAQARRLLRLLLLWNGKMPADASK
jgi:hypothetical protein